MIPTFYSRLINIVMLIMSPYHKNAMAICFVALILPTSHSCWMWWTNNFRWWPICHEISRKFHWCYPICQEISRKFRSQGQTLAFWSHLWYMWNSAQERTRRTINKISNFLWISPSWWWNYLPMTHIPSSHGPGRLYMHADAYEPGKCSIGTTVCSIWNHCLYQPT